MATRVTTMSLPLRGAVESTWMGEALGIELASRNKLNDLGCVRGLRNLSSLIKGTKRRQSRLSASRLRKLVKLLPNDKLLRATAARQNWRLPPCRMDTAV
jgi:hypothetical protein